MVRARTAALESALAEAEAASRAKSQFLATMSHELRTPLNAVIGFSNQLQKNKARNLLPRDLEFLQRICDNGTHLLKLINDVLDLSRIEAGKMSIERTSVNLESLLGEVLEQTAASTSRASAVATSVSIPARIRAFPGDEPKLRRVLINLTANALKFTERGHVVLSVVADDTGTPRRVDVIDTGIGIPSDRLSAVFDRFEQADNSTQRRFGGTGLGLTISKTLCDVMGYRLGVVSELGVGSAFSVMLEPGAVPPASYAEVATVVEKATLTAG